MLTAQLTIAEPAPDAIELPDTIARPRQDSETFAADPRRSPCLITPEVLPYLGETVAVQVTTNEAGQATDASVRQSSRSPVYDDLAVCMVKQWQFEPAIDQGTPVPSSALVVAVRIQ
jgi:TonB family protein